MANNGGKNPKSLDQDPRSSSYPDSPQTDFLAQKYWAPSLANRSRAPQPPVSTATTSASYTYTPAPLMAAPAPTISPYDTTHEPSQHQGTLSTASQPHRSAEQAKGEQDTEGASSSRKRGRSPEQPQSSYGYVGYSAPVQQTRRGSPDRPDPIPENIASLGRSVAETLERQRRAREANFQQDDPMSEGYVQRIIAETARSLQERQAQEASQRAADPRGGSQRGGSQRVGNHGVEDQRGRPAKRGDGRGKK